jgi:penicillin G amidase
MYLDLGVPNIWYRAELHYGDVHLACITLPGIPLVISGSNGHIAWGFTGSGMDVLDLVAVEVNPQYPSQYKTAEGWRPFDVRDEVVHVKGAADETLTMRSTVWGPVLPMPFFDKPFAVYWIALDAQSLLCPRGENRNRWRRSTNWHRSGSFFMCSLRTSSSCRAGQPIAAP